MKQTLIILLFTAMLGLAAQLPASDNYAIYSRNGDKLSVRDLSILLSSGHPVFFGEYHDDAVCHSLELELIQNMYKISPQIVISMEMFERDTQSVLDAYLKGEITEEEFLAKSRPWPNYQTDYRPIIEFAKAKGIPVIAANVPRKYAALLAVEGETALAALPDSEKAWIAKKLVIEDGEYKNDFMQTMRMNGVHAAKGDSAAYENMFAAQCLKDDTMAESILKAMEKYQLSVVIHVNGNFHSRKHLGTVEKLENLSPDLHVAVISPAYVDSSKPLVWDETLKEEGDFIILIHNDNPLDE